ncbi:magnesium transporter CorA family protein [Botrimarina hoheduenensis]|uniref:Magnesium transport protein CorA n=1 Tax=Botrimarina hoheduenensis TaxID=2528000 RepID=A0A5C5WAK4_9BACT|nr:magnesium transporter CorA family protein [Botrimarina hoheduenensis]TWT46632.1 Magnesium transport protein CorA [Botrimarina hoheduenensis]
MIWGIGRKSHASPIEFSSFEELQVLWNHQDAFAWVDLEAPSADDLQRLDLLIDLDDQSLEDCLHGEPRARIDEFDDCLLIVAYGVIAHEGSDEVEARKLTIFRGERFLVTIHSQPSRSVNALRERCRKSPKQTLDQGFDRMLYRLIDGMVDRYLTLIDLLEDDLDAYEERSFEMDGNDPYLQQATTIRRKLIDLRRLASAQRGLIDPLADGDFDSMSTDLGQQFRVVRSHLTHAVERCEGMLDRLNAALQNYNSSVAKRTNDVVRTLTVLTAVMMPMSVIAGVYGMNFPTWPGNDNPISFVAVTAVMVAVGLTMAALFRFWRWL